MGVVSVNPQASQVQGVFADKLLIQNTGTTVVYMGSDSSVSPTTGFQLPPGAYGEWQGSVPLWVCTDAGKASTLVTQDGALGMFIPAPSQVTIQGGTVELSGTADVTIDGGSLNVGTISKPKQIDTFSSFNVGTVLNPGTLFGGNTYDVSAYGSILVTVMITPTGAAPDYTKLNNNIAIAIQQGGSYDQAVFTFGQTVQQTFLVPVKSSQAIISAGAQIGSVTNGATVTVTIFGVTTQFDREYVNDFSGGGGLNTNGAQTFTGSVASTGSSPMPFSSTNTRLSIGCRQASNPAQTLIFEIGYSNQAGTYARLAAAAVNTTATVYYGQAETQLPCYPACYVMRTNAANTTATGYELSLSREG